MKKICEANKYASIDIAKFFLALLVVAIHEMPFVSYSRIVNAFFVNEICRIAVPLFFISTGFFLAIKGIERESIKKYALKILKMYLLWSGVYFVLQIICNGFNISVIIDYLFRLIGGGNGHIWYLYSSIIGVIVAAALFLRISKKAAILVSVVLYLVGAIVNDLWNILPLTSELADFIYAFLQHSFFMALPYILIGMCLSTGSENSSQRKYEIVIFIALLTLENGILFKLNTSIGYQNNVFMFPLAVCVFRVLLSINVEDGRYLQRFRFYSTYIYLVQGVFIAFVDTVLKNSLIKYLLVVVLCIIFSEIFFRFKCHRSPDLRKISAKNSAK